MRIKTLQAPALMNSFDGIKYNYQNDWLVLQLILKFYTLKKVRSFLMYICSLLFWISCIAFLMIMLGAMIYYAFQSIYFGLISNNPFKITVSIIFALIFLLLLLGILFQNKQVSAFLFKTCGYFMVTIFLILHFIISITCIIIPFTDVINIEFDLKLIIFTPLFFKILLFIIGLYAAVRTYIFADEFLFSNKKSSTVNRKLN